MFFANLSIICCSECNIGIICQPSNIVLKHFSELNLRFSVNLTLCKHGDFLPNDYINVTTTDPNIAHLNDSVINIYENTILNLKGSYIGVTRFNFSINRPNISISMVNGKIVVLSKNSMNVGFKIFLGLLIIVYNIGFGCKLEISLLINILKRPIAPALGFFCQFGLMAPVSKYL